MYPNIIQLKEFASRALNSMHEQGYDVQRMKERFETMPDSYDAVYQLLGEMRRAPIRETFPYVEPDSFSEILDACGI